MDVSSLGLALSNPVVSLLACVLLLFVERCSGLLPQLFVTPDKVHKAVRPLSPTHLVGHLFLSSSTHGKPEKDSIDQGPSAPLHSALSG